MADGQIHNNKEHRCLEACNRAFDNGPRSLEGRL